MLNIIFKFLLHITLVSAKKAVFRSKNMRCSNQTKEKAVTLSEGMHFGRVGLFAHWDLFVVSHTSARLHLCMVVTSNFDACSKGDYYTVFTTRSTLNASPQKEPLASSSTVELMAVMAQMMTT